MKRLLGLILGILISASAEAQEPRALTLPEVVALAQQNAPQAVQAKGQIRSSASGVRTAYAAFLPTFSLSAGATKQSSGSRTRVENGQIIILPEQPWSSSIGYGANVVLFDGGGRFFDLRQAQARSAAAKVNELTQHFDIALSAKQAFFNVLAAREAQSAAAAQLEQAEQQRKVSVARARAKVATRSDSLRAEIQVRNGQLAVLEAKNALETANAGLARVVGSAAPVTAANSDSIYLPGLALDEVTLRGLVENGPAVQLAKADLDVAHAAEKGTWTNYLPSLSASYSRSGSGTGETPTLNDQNFDYSGSFRLSLSLPVFDQLRREQQVTQAQVARQNAEAALRDQRLAAVESMVQALGTFESAAERVSSETATVEAAEEDLRVQQQRYVAGGSTLLDVLGSQTQLNQARRDLIRARYDQRVAKAQLESLVGREL